MAETRNLAILIVDDRPENLASMKQLLARDGLDILTAESGNTALGMMLENDLALVLLDVQMPGMDGFEVAELMHRNDQTRRIPIIFVTAINKERRHIFSGFEAGAVDYMFKPVDPFIIRSKVEVFLDIKRNEIAREQLVNELAEANRMLKEISDRKSDFLSAASHELRTPLTVIKEYCGLVHDGVVGEINPEQKRCLQASLRNCNRLADLVNDLLDLDSIESGHALIERTSVDINQILADSFADFSARCESVDQKIRWDGQENLPPVLGDAQMVTQALVNLLGNAHKFTPHGGEITIRGSHTADGVRIEVQDNGPGIDEEDQVKVFEKFTQLNRKDGPGAKGTGLGLAISHKIIEMHEGELGLKSDPGQGAVFHFTIPVYSTAAHMAALINDGTSRGPGNRMDWVLVLLKPTPAQASLPDWLNESVDGLIRRFDDIPAEIKMDGFAVKAVLLQADRDGAHAFLSRLDESLPAAGISSDQLFFALQEITREARTKYEWKPEEIEFSSLGSAQMNKGLSYV